MKGSLSMNGERKCCSLGKKSCSNKAARNVLLQQNMG